MILRSKKPSVAGRLFLAGLTTLAAMGVVNAVAARLAEKSHPPKGTFIDVDGVRLHYTDRGEGPPVVLIHGNAMSGDDFDTSGLSELLIGKHRVIIFDRPGFGHTVRPRGKRWTADEQADLIYRAFRKLGVAHPVVVGHSWGAIAALALGVRHQDDIAGLVLLAGYYFPTARPDVLLATLGAAPVIGEILNHTTTPLVGGLTMPLFKKALFSPAAIPQRFQQEYSPAMALRPSAVAAASADGAQMVPAVKMLRRQYAQLTKPVVIFAGDGDKVVFMEAAEKLHLAIRGSDLNIVKGAGHMVHHVAAAQVAKAIDGVAARGQKSVAPI